MLTGVLFTEVTWFHVMLLKNLMEDKQLNFYQPLLSVRRSSPTVPTVEGEKRKTDHFRSKIPPPLLPSYKSELKSGPLKNAGMVPFVWEQSPGRPKDESRPRNHAVERPPIAPKLPPGRILKTTKQDSDISSEHPTLSKRHGEVPYCSQRGSASNQNVPKLESSRYTMDVESSDSGEGDETYLDALDTLSRTESVSLNCSVSGISGLDGSGLHTSGDLLADLQTRDFMMGRFLPAAKAMTSETPQYAPRKQPVVWEQPRQIMNVVSGDKRPSLRYGPNVGPHYSRGKDLEESDDEHGQFSAKVCGLLPPFCLKSSLCRLNLVPGMSVRTRVPMYPGSRTHGSSSSAGSSCENENEHIRTTIYEQRSSSDLQSTEFHEDMSGSNYKLDQLSCPFNPQKLEGSDLYKRLQGNGMPTHHNELPRSAFSEQKGFRSTTGESKSIEETGFSSELLADNGEVDAGSPMIEKTLYVDIVHKVEPPSINSYDSDMKGGNVLKNLTKWKPVEETPSVESSFKDTENLNVEGEEANLRDISQKHDDFSVPSLADKSNQVLATNTLKGFGQYEGLNDDLTTFVKSKGPHNVNMDFETQQPPKAEDLEISNGKCFKFPVPPPLPKSPSDSWLWRTLPSMSSRTPSLQSHFGTRIHPGNHASKTSSVHPKWGASVKTTMGQHQNVQSSEELLMPILETWK